MKPEVMKVLFSKLETYRKYFFVIKKQICKKMFVEISWINMVHSSIGPDIRLFSVSGNRPDIRHAKSGIRTDTGYKKAGFSGRISVASLVFSTGISTG
jgi:hypothetical protein